MRAILLSVVVAAGCVTGDLDSSEPQVPVPLPAPGPVPVPGQTVLAPALTREIISDAVAVVKPEILECGSASVGAGIVKLHVKVAASGAVTSATVKVAPNPDLGTCAARAMERATFAQTEQGGSFSYPFVF